MTLDERILVATDLGAHSDRALDRAVALARERDAHLTVLHVIEQSALHAHRPLTAAALAAKVERQLAIDVGADRDRTSIRIERGVPADVIERVAREGRHHIVVVGGERVDRLGHRTLAKTVERLLRRVDVPLLVVAERPRGPYRNVAVAVDFSSASALTVELLPPCSLRSGSSWSMYVSRSRTGAANPPVITTTCSTARAWSMRIGSPSVRCLGRFATASTCESRSVSHRACFARPPSEADSTCSWLAATGTAASTSC